MAATRMRFTPAERDAFTPGTEVEYLDVTRWYPATVVDIETDDTRQQRAKLKRTHPLTRTQLQGEHIWSSPKHVRLPAAARTGKYV
jgi:hypothetical protein